MKYEVAFRRPAFGVASAPIALADSFHKVIAPRYAFGPDDIAVESGRNLAETCLTISLFNGNGKLEVTPTVFRAKFLNPVGEQDRKIIEDCITLGLEALQKGAPDIAFDRESFLASLFVDLTEDPKDSGKFLRAAIPGASVWSLDVDSPRTEVIPALKTELENLEEGWRFGITVERAQRSRTELFVLVAAQFEPHGKLATLSEKSAHFMKCFQDAISRIGLSWAQPEA